MMGANASAENTASTRFLKELEERGVNVHDMASLSSALQNPRIMSEVMTEVNRSQGVTLGISIAASTIGGSPLINNAMAGAADGGLQAAMEGRSAADIVHATNVGIGQGAASSVLPGRAGQAAGAVMDVSFRM